MDVVKTKVWNEKLGGGGGGGGYFLEFESPALPFRRNWTTAS